MTNDNQSSGTSRRDFLRAGLLGLVGLAVGSGRRTMADEPAVELRAADDVDILPKLQYQNCASATAYADRTEVVLRRDTMRGGKATMTYFPGDEIKDHPYLVFSFGQQGIGVPPKEGIVTIRTKDKRTRKQNISVQGDGAQHPFIVPVQHYESKDGKTVVYPSSISFEIAKKYLPKHRDANLSMAYMFLSRTGDIPSGVTGAAPSEAREYSEPAKDF